MTERRGRSEMVSESKHAYSRSLEHEKKEIEGKKKNQETLDVNNSL